MQIYGFAWRFCELWKLVYKLEFNHPDFNFVEIVPPSRKEGMKISGVRMLLFRVSRNENIGCPDVPLSRK
jgi:hypothetical protein